MNEPVYDDSKSRPLGPESLPEPDPRIRDGSGRQPATEPAPAQDRHEAGRPEGGQFR